MSDKLLNKNQENKRLVKNSLLLYFRMFFNMAVGVFTSRIIMQALGIEDYGIYNLVAGVVILINIMNNGLSTASSRFITYELGKVVDKNVSKVFTSSFQIHFILACLFLILAESVGLWFINTKLIIAEDRLIAANWVYQFTILSTIINITQVPYNALIISHEKFSVYAYFEIINTFLKLIIACVTLYVTYDHLVFYSLLYCIVTICVALLYRYYCIKNYVESHLIIFFDKNLLFKMLKFSGWSVLSTSSLTLSQQGLNIIINRFFGVILNASLGIANQVQSVLYAFIGNITAAFNPQITKSFAEANYSRVNELVLIGTRLTSSLMVIVSIPIICEMEWIMNLWLVEVPIGAIEICRINLIFNILLSFTPLCTIAITASGKIALFNVITSIVFLLRIPLALIFLNITHSYIIVMLVCLSIPILSGIINIYFLKKIISSFSVSIFVKNLYIPAFVIGVISLFVGLFIHNIISNVYLRVLSVFIMPTLISSLLLYIFILDKKTKNIIKSKMRIKL